MEEVIATRNLTKTFKDVNAVKDLNLNVNSGEIFGFLGPNGAGKTTTVRVLTTLAKPSSGSIWVSGFDVTKEPDKVKKVIGVVQQHLTLDLDLNLRENMELHARLHHIPSNERNQRIDELLAYVGSHDRNVMLSTQSLAAKYEATRLVVKSSLLPLLPMMLSK